MTKKKDNKWKQVANFLLGVEENRSGRYVVLRTKEGTWSTRWRDDTLMFGILLSLTDNEESVDYLHALFTMMFISCMHPHDLVALGEKQEMPMMNAFAKMYMEAMEYEASVLKQPTEEEEKTALEESAAIEGMREELEKMEEE